MERLLQIYHDPAPAFLAPFLRTPELQRLKDVGMNCGCEYTSFPLFLSMPPSSRYRHSLGAALITWHFTTDRAQTLAALFHDAATPTFSHSIDFLRGDHLRQEATEDGTERLLEESAEIPALLAALGLTVDDVKDYHRYPVADNDAPRLSADRLEYTLGNLLGYGFCSLEEIRAFYADLRVAVSPDGVTELAFGDEETALAFARGALRCSRIYVAPEDRYSMQMLAELVGRAIARGALTPEDLYTTETAVIEKLCLDAESRADWLRYRALHEMVTDDSAPPDRRRVIRAKKRYIDPLIAGKGRLSEQNAAFRAELAQFLSDPQEQWLCAR